MRLVSISGCIAALGLPLLLGACGEQLPADATDRVDGSYKGRPVSVVARSSNCPGTDRGRIEVGDGTLYFAYTPETIFIAPIQQDGRMHVQAGRSVLDGTVKDGWLRMVITTPVCETHYDMHFVI